MKIRNSLAIASGLAFAAMTLLTPAAAQAVATKCSMKFNLREYAAAHQMVRGRATIACENGENAMVSLELNAGGFVSGKSSIQGSGQFSEVSGIADLLGSYEVPAATVGAAKSELVMTKGDVKLALSSSRHRWEDGLSFGKFTIARP